MLLSQLHRLSPLRLNPPPKPVYSATVKIVGLSGYSYVGHGQGKLNVILSTGYKIPFASNCRYLYPGENKSIECRLDNGDLVSFNSGKQDIQYAISSQDFYVAAAPRCFYPDKKTSCFTLVTHFV